jgi:hypothetical protein
VTGNASGDTGGTYNYWYVDDALALLPMRTTAIAIAGLAMFAATILAITMSTGRATTPNRRMHASETGRWPLNSLACG